AFETVSVWASVPAAATGSGESVSVIDRSALGTTTVVSSLALLFDESGSGVVADTSTALVTVPLQPVVSTSRVIAGAAPVASDAAVQVTVGVAKLQVHPVPVALTNV